MRPLLWVAATAALGLTACGAPECEFTEATGLFEIFKTEGCLAPVDTGIDPSQGTTVIVSHASNTILVDGIDSLNISLAGRLYPGRQGRCYLSDADADHAEAVSGHCDYVIGAVNKVSSTETRYEINIVSAFMSWHAKQGSFKARMTPTAFDQGFGP